MHISTIGLLFGSYRRVIVWHCSVCWSQVHWSLVGLDVIKTALGIVVLLAILWLSFTGVGVLWSLVEAWLREIFVVVHHFDRLSILGLFEAKQVLVGLVWSSVFVAIFLMVIVEIVYLSVVLVILYSMLQVISNSVSSTTASHLLLALRCWCARRSITVDTLVVLVSIRTHPIKCIIKISSVVGLQICIMSLCSHILIIVTLPILLSCSFIILSHSNLRSCFFFGKD